MAERFTALDNIDNHVVEDFTRLLSELSKSFAEKGNDEKRSSVERNLSAALEARDALVLVHRDPIKRQVVASATGNIVLGREAWVDDVVTRSDFRGYGLGFESMQTLHEHFQSKGIGTVRLTSSFDREVAGNLYTKMGYVERGDVSRADLSTQPITGYIEETPLGFEPVNCFIPTGDKAWIYGPEEGTDPADYVDGILTASDILRSMGIASANHFSVENPSPTLADALDQTGFVQRSTRLYTLSLPTLQ